LIEKSSSRVEPRAVIISGLYGPLKTTFFEFNEYIGPIHDTLTWKNVIESVEKKFENCKFAKTVITKVLTSSRFYTISLDDANDLDHGDKTLEAVTKTPVNKLLPPKVCACSLSTNLKRSLKPLLPPDHQRSERLRRSDYMCTLKVEAQSTKG